MTNLSKSFCLGVFFPSGFGTDTHEKCCILISEIFPKMHLRLSSVDFFSRGSMPPNPPRTGAYTQFRPRYAPGDPFPSNNSTILFPKKKIPSQ